MPHATLTFCSLFAGRCWCLCPGWHSGHLIVHHQWEHSFLCARSSPKVPTTLMGTLLTRLTRFSFAQLCERRFGQLYTVGACCRDRKFPPHTLLGFSRLCLMFRAFVLAGRWCQCQFWHSHDYVFLDLWQRSCPYCVHSCSKSVHLPLRRLTFCSLFAGWRCLCRGWHSGHLMVHYQWEHSL